ncbi:hypothetical protein L208DRAFT_1230558, partial [Tricholoma matsutake]
MTKIVNSLSTKMEMENIISCMYLLGNPNHYSNLRFWPFYWQDFVMEVRKPWVQELTKQDSNMKAAPDKVAICQHNGWVVGLSPVHDYIFHVEEMETMCLHDWVLRCECEKL